MEPHPYQKISSCKILRSEQIRVGKHTLKITWINFPLVDNQMIAGGGSEVIIAKDAVFIGIKDRSEVYGIGEASFVTVPGRVEPNVSVEIEHFLHLASTVDSITNLHVENPRLRYALSVAYMDLKAKLKERPLWQEILDACQERGIQGISATVPLVKVVIFENEHNKLEQYLGRYSRFKLKISPRTFDDVVALAIDLSAKGCVITLDANFTFENRWDLVEQIDDYVKQGLISLEYLEQPLKPYSDENPEAIQKMAALAKRAPNLRLGLDQDIRSITDCIRWSGQGYVYVVKVSAFGSLEDIIHAISQSKPSGIAIGGMIETVIGKASLAHVQAALGALSLGYSAEISPPDKYFFENWLLQDCKTIVPNNSLLAIPHGPGLGVHLSTQATELLCP